MSRAIGAPFAEALAAEIPFLVELENLVEIPTGLQMCHRDLWADNLPPGDAGGVWVIDWENCGLASPTHELPMALVDFCDGNQDRTSTLYAAYVEAGGPARLRRPGDFTMVIAQFGHFWEKAVTAYLDPAAPAEQRAHSIERIVELTNAPLRIEQIHAVLDWTAHAN